MPKDIQYQIACLTTAKVFIFFSKRSFTVYLKREGNWDARCLLAVKVGVFCPLLGEKPEPK